MIKKLYQPKGVKDKEMIPAKRSKSKRNYTSQKK